jgi:hypothetical protein
MRSRRADRAVFLFGVILLVAAVVGGSVKGAGVEIPILKSGWQQVLIAGIGVMVMVCSVALSFITGNGTVERGGLVFARITIDSGDTYWCESSKTPASKHYPFDRQVHQRFRIAKQISGADPVFDVTLLNTASKPAVVSDVGVEILSVAHMPYGMNTGGTLPQAIRVDRLESYMVAMPNVWRDVVKDMDPDEDVWVERNEVVKANIKDPIFLEPNAPFRYRLRLKGYESNMPNHTIMRMWATSYESDVRSETIAVQYHLS